MKKILFAAMVVALIVTVTPSMAEGTGAKGFFAGCCFGLRVGADYNDGGTGDRDYMPWFLTGLCLGPRAQMDYTEGKDLHWREFCRLIPYAGAVFAIWDGIDISAGKGRADLQEMYGANYY